MSSAPPQLPFCIECGLRLDAIAQTCPRCGTRRLAEPPADRPGGAATDRASGRRELTPAEVDATVSSIPWIYAVGAILCVGLLAWLLAEAVAPGGEANWNATMTQARIPTSEFAATRIEMTAFFGVILFLLAAGHAIAFQGLRAKKRWGWIVAIVLAALWSVVIAGIPVLIRLSQRQVRAVYGVT